LARSVFKVASKKDKVFIFFIFKFFLEQFFFKPIETAKTIETAKAVETARPVVRDI